MSNARQTILIAGGGIAGLAFAVAIKQAAGEALAIEVFDPAFVGSASSSGFAARQISGGRVSSVAPDVQRLFEALGVWRDVRDQAQPIFRMRITDSRNSDPVRADMLRFGDEKGSSRPLAHMVPNAALLQALLRQAVDAGVMLTADNVERWSVGGAGATGGEVRLSSGDTRRADLLVAADGANSQLRALAGIAWTAWSYGQSGIVATICHERPHRSEATQHFMPTGPLAILPVCGNRSSIVWSLPEADAAWLTALDPSDFVSELRSVMGQELGALSLMGERAVAFPLGFGVARCFTARSLALIGDAAHLVHPIAGQGMNLGLRDVGTLVELVLRGIRVGLTAGDAGVLENYNRLRRSEVLSMGAATDVLNRLFSNDSPAARLVRDFGLRLVDRVPDMKRMLVGRATGSIGSQPALLRGVLPRLI